MGKSIITTIARPSLPRITAAPRWLDMTPKGYALGMVSAELPKPKSRRGRRVARKARKAAYRRAFAEARNAQGR